ncbi:MULTISPECIES: hydroxymethylglutaryl-CoA synthase family protein [Streptomyces]|uniref:hydroxymethylglutaryl-CoA synthase family protein n=1 Tax=Streptomyces TaxID=1883 RepID=UPI0004AB6F3C|nr:MULTISPECIES: hydroxymethylglutaryl-CoA synthase [Streptomyces]
MTTGIQAINAYVGRTSLDVGLLFRTRDLDMGRFGNLLMAEKSVNLPCEDAISNAVNAAKPLVDALGPEEREQIELLVVGTESGVDYAKPISTYVHEYLGLSPRCRSFEVKHACYGGTAALRTALGIIGTAGHPGRRALVIAADAAGVVDRNTYWEPSQGAGAVAMLVGAGPGVFVPDQGAYGLHTAEVMDTYRPEASFEAGDSDLSLMSYLEALQKSWAMYADRVEGADIRTTFAHLVFHSPFAGMVKGAHRTLLRRLARLPEDEITADFERRLADSLRFCSTVGNTYSAALYLGLCSLLEHGDFRSAQRIGLFSYGSGCASEFYSGVVPAGAGDRTFGVRDAIAARVPLTIPEYELVSDLSVRRMGGVKDWADSTAEYADVYARALDGRGLLVLDRIDAYHRKYRWS